MRKAILSWPAVAAACAAAALVLPPAVGRAQISDVQSYVCVDGRSCVQGTAAEIPFIRNDPPPDIGTGPFPPGVAPPVPRLQSAAPPPPSRRPVVMVLLPPAAFDKADLNHDGKLDRAEFNTTARAQAPNNARKAWDAADVNKDGFVSREEFMTPLPAPAGVALAPAAAVQ